MLRPSTQRRLYTSQGFEALTKLEQAAIVYQ